MSHINQQLALEDTEDTPDYRGSAVVLGVRASSGPRTAYRIRPRRR